jgi:hypothetical protein
VGIRFFPAGVRVKLDLLEERRFGNGTVYHRYRTAPAVLAAGDQPVALEAIARHLGPAFVIAFDE